MLVATCRAAGDATHALGTFWRGALGVMQTLVAAMNHHRLKTSTEKRAHTGSETEAPGPG